MAIVGPRTSVTINNGAPLPASLTIDQDVEMVRSDRATKPDPSWSYIDDSGHFHAYTQGGETPTLDRRAEHVDCDGSCGGVCEGEGYTIDRYYCQICSQHVEPRFIPDYEARDIGVPVYTRRSATLIIQSDAPLTYGGAMVNSGAKVSLRVHHGDDDEMVGVGAIQNVAGEFSSNATRWTYTIIADQLEPRLTSAG